MAKGHPPQERRRYIRLNSVFPVQFRVLSAASGEPLSGCLQGFTNNIGRGGICLTVNNLGPDLAESLRGDRAALSLEIQMPLAGSPARASARVAWIRTAEKCPNGYLIGLSYEKIDPAANKRLMRYAWGRKLIIPVLTGAIIVFGLGFGLNGYISAKLIKGNKALIGQLVSIVQKSSIAKQKVKAISRQREDIEVKLKALDLQIRTAGEESAKSADNKKALASLSQELEKQKADLQEKLIVLQRQESAITEDLLQLDKVKTSLEEANLEKMYKWLKARQNMRTGLVVSIEGGDGQPNQAITAEQALAALAYVRFADFQRARMIFNFFKKKAAKSGDLFLGIYNADNAKPLQYVAQSGPNIWLGIAMLQYTERTKDRRYLSLAEEIAAQIILRQKTDAQGGIPSAEIHPLYYVKDNLDAYAFFSLLHKITGGQEYLEASVRVLNWLLNNAYGKGGAGLTKAAGDVVGDMSAWSIEAIGPEKLEALGVNPDRIIESAEEDCGAKVCYLRPEGVSVEIKGYGFGPDDRISGGIISSERTAAMAIAFKIMADFCYQKGMIAKGRAYALKVGEYLSELDNMIISSPSAYSQGESCLPYASQDILDDSYGIKLIRSKAAGSITGTVYTLFAYYNYNPLSLSES